MPAVFLTFFLPPLPLPFAACAAAADVAIFCTPLNTGAFFSKSGSMMNLM
jgi:hypothetical protein